MIKAVNVLVAVVLFCFCACQAQPVSQAESYRVLKQKINSEFHKRKPKQWSQTISGVVTGLPVGKNMIALTFDACGSAGDSYDKALIDYLIENNIPATLFFTARWIDKNPDVFKSLAANPLFEIENHGFMHKPCSVSGRSIYGIKGTGNIDEAVDEVEKGALKIARVTGKKPLFYRSGTAYYDEVAIAIVKRLGYMPAGFSALGDAGATYQLWEVKKALLAAKDGDIFIFHMNHPGSNALEGIQESMPVLRDKGFKFVKLKDGLKETVGKLPDKR